MSDVEGQAPVDNESTATTNPSEDDPKWLRAELERTRKEAASRRVLSKEHEAKLAEYEEWKKSQMTEQERLATEKAELAAENARLKSEKTRIEAATSAGLDPSFASRLVGSTDEELRADAKELAKKFKPAGLFPAGGSRDNGAAGSGAPSTNEWFLSLFKD